MKTTRKLVWVASYTKSDFSLAARQFRRVACEEPRRGFALPCRDGTVEPVVTETPKSEYKLRRDIDFRWEGGDLTYVNTTDTDIEAGVWLVLEYDTYEKGDKVLVREGSYTKAVVGAVKRVTPTGQYVVTYTPSNEKTSREVRFRKDGWAVGRWHVGAQPKLVGIVELASDVHKGEG